MATYTGKDGQVTVGGNAIGELKDWSLEESMDPIEDTVMGDTARTYNTGLTSWSGSCTAFWDDTDTAQDALTIGASVALIFKPEGADTGDDTATGTGLVTGITKSAVYDGMIEASFTFQGNGALTWGTHA